MTVTHPWQVERLFTDQKRNMLLAGELLVSSIVQRATVLVVTVS